ncbi:type I pullulanase [Mycoplasmatota bacterium WC44]
MYARLEKIDLIKLYDSNEEDVFLELDNEKIKLEVNNNEILFEGIDFSKEYFIIQGDSKTPLIFGDCVRDHRFDDMFFYDGKLGFDYSKDSTTFKIWSPISSDVKLLLNGEEYDMKRNNGVWVVTVNEDCEGLKYKYKLKIHHEWRESIDPYAISSNANGEYSYVIDIEKTKIDLKRNRSTLKNFTDAIIYEVSIRDFTYSDDSVTNKSKFIGLLESKDKGLKYIKDLGITHIQLMPIYDFRTVDEIDQFKKYNWGYDPHQYNVPEGSYSTDPNDPYKRIIELKELVRCCHEAGLNVNMDVVYNHVYEHTTHPFHLVMPGYYFRYDDSGNISAGTGCGNDTESRRKMVFKYIVDSVLYWQKEFGLDGFRFDLMGIHHSDLMNEVRRSLDKIDPTIMVYGEGWNMGTEMPEKERATILNYKEMGTVGHFNDRFRNYLKGDNFIEKSKGFLLDIDLTEHIKYVLRGSLFDSVIEAYFSEPYHTINYVECHDDLTLYDKLEILECENIKEKQRLAIGLIILSQGIPFLHSGFEFLRTKNGEHNTYNMSDDFNKVDWELASENQDLIEHTKALINIRKEYPHFRLSSKKDIERHVSVNVMKPGILEYKINLNEELLVIINGTDKSFVTDYNDIQVIFGSLEANNICIMKKVG